MKQIPSKQRVWMKTRGFRHPKKDLTFKTSMEKIESTNIKFLFTRRRIKPKKKKEKKKGRYADELHYITILIPESCMLK